MKTIKIFSKFSIRIKSYAFFLALLLPNLSLFAQCNIVPLVSSSVCNNMNTLDPTDDVFTIIIYVSSENTGTWIADDPNGTTGSYNTTKSFGPYSVSGGDVTITFTDSSDPTCSEQLTIMAPTNCNVTCPTYNVCYEMISSDECTATYIINFDAAISGYTLSMLNFFFNIGNGSLESVGFISANSVLQNNGVILTPTSTGFEISGGVDVPGNQVTGAQITFTVSAEPNECVNITRSTGGMYFDGIPCMVMGDPKCDALETPFCALGTEIGGFISSYHPFGSECENGVEGVDVSVTSASGGSCETTTNDSGKYSCTLCGPGPFTVCVDTECPEPCGLTSLDVYLMIRLIIGYDQMTPFMQYIGDVNGDGMVSGVDVIQVNRVVNGVADNVDNWCSFLPVEDILSIGNPGPFSEIVDDACRTISGNDTSQDFIRMMLGDMDGSCNDCVHGDNLGDLPLVINDDGVGSMTVELSEGTEFYYSSIEFIIPNGIEINDINSSVDHMEYNITENKIKVSWLNEEDIFSPLKYDRNSSLLTISYTNASSTSSIYLGNGDNIIMEGNGITNRLTTVKGNTKQIIVDSGTAIAFKSFSETVNVSVLNISGRNVWSNLISIRNEITDLDLMNKNIASGIYILNISNESVNKSVKIFIP